MFKYLPKWWNFARSGHTEFTPVKCCYLLSGNLDAHVTACHHDAVGGRNDLVNVLAALLVLQLRNDEDVLAGFAQNVPVGRTL